MVYSTMLAVCGTDGHGFKSQTTPMLADTSVDQKALAAMLTSIQSAGVTSEVNLRITQVRKHAMDPPWL